MEIRRTGRQSAQDRSFELPDIRALSGHQRATWIARCNRLPGRVAHDCEQWQVGRSPRCVGDTDVERRRKRVVAHARRVMARPTVARD